MEHIRMQVFRDEKHWCHVDITGLNAAAVLSDLQVRFDAASGFTYLLFKKTGERRLLESTPAGIKLMSAEPIFVSV